MSLTIKELISILPQIGKVEWISIRPEKRGAVKPVDEVEVTVESGLVGDHYSKRGGKRMVTFIQEEHIDVVGGVLGKSIDPKQLRRNIVISGINLLALKDKTFQVGEEAQFKTTGLCHPCSRMETNLGAGGYNAMRGHGGITTTVIKSGKIKVGDQVQVIKLEEEG